MWDSPAYTSSLPRIGGATAKMKQKNAGDGYESNHSLPKWEYEMFENGW